MKILEKYLSQANNWTTTKVVWRNCFQSWTSSKRNRKYAYAASIALGTGAERDPTTFFPWETSEEKLESLPEKKFKIPINVGPIALKNLKKYLTKDMGDSTYGFKNDGNEYYLGKTKVDFKGDNIKIGEKNIHRNSWSLEFIYRERTG